MHVFQELIGNGFVRARSMGWSLTLDDAPALDKNKKHTIEAVVDRVRVKDDIAQRLAESFETALNLSDGVAQVVDMDDPELPATVFSARFVLPKLRLLHYGTGTQNVLVQQPCRRMCQL